MSDLVHMYCGMLTIKGENFKSISQIVGVYELCTQHPVGFGLHNIDPTGIWLRHCRTSNTDSGEKIVGWKVEGDEESGKKIWVADIKACFTLKLRVANDVSIAMLQAATLQLSFHIAATSYVLLRYVTQFCKCIYKFTTHSDVVQHSGVQDTFQYVVLKM